MEADTWATCTARLEAGELADHTDPRTNTPRHAPLGRASGTPRQAASGHQRSVRHTKRRPGPTKRALLSFPGSLEGESRPGRNLRRALDLQAQLRQTGMIRWTRPERPTVLALALLNRLIVDAGDAAPHKSVFVDGAPPYSITGRLSSVRQLLGWGLDSGPTT